MSDDRVMKALLLDYYGELLTEKQREYYDLHYNSDLSLYEIAEQSGVSRQAVWDIIRRADAILAQTEEKTGFVARAEKRRELLSGIRADMNRLLPLVSGQAQEIASGISSKLDSLSEQ